MNQKDLFHALEVEMENAPEVVKPSRFWQELNAKHRQELLDAGIDNFRRTLARKYFTWTRVLPWDSQIRFLTSELPLSTTANSVLRTFHPFKHDHIGLAESLASNFLTNLLWSYALLQDPRLTELRECEFGNPPRIKRNGRLISQDLANSFLEYLSFEDAFKGTIVELGGGYGRTAYVSAQLGQFDRYVFVDIPPALGVAQSFIEAAFPNEKIFKFRAFEDFDQIEDEFYSSKFAFLLPHQAQALPSNSVDLFINISSLHEMPIEQIEYYLSEIRRLVKEDGHLYLKAWKESPNPYDEVSIDEKDYDLNGFTEVFWRTSKVQTRFFETLQRRNYS